MSLWVEKYRPLALDEFIGSSSVKNKIKSIIDSGEMSNLLFYGKAGTGKTSLAKIIIKSIPCDSFYINGNDDNGIEFMRTKIKKFAEKVPMNGVNLLFVDEANRLTTASQEIFRGYLESYHTNFRVIFTTNYLEDTIEPLRSRLQVMEIKPLEKKVILQKCEYILKEENVTYDIEDVMEIILAHYPDIRKVINVLQQSTINNNLVLSAISKNDNVIPRLIEMINKKEKITKIRQYLINTDNLDYNQLYNSLFDNIDEISTEDNEGDILFNLSEYAFRNNFSAIDKEIHFTACINKLLNL